MQERLSWAIDMAAGPIYIQIARNVRRLLARGELSPGDRLPSSRELAQTLGVNPNTVVHGYSKLEIGGVIETRRGLGTFIRADAPVGPMRQEMLRDAASGYADEAIALEASREEAIDVLKEVFDAGKTE
jgi:GntR family transcriptional regulator